MWTRGKSRAVGRMGRYTEQAPTPIQSYSSRCETSVADPEFKIFLIVWGCHQSFRGLTHDNDLKYLLEIQHLARDCETATATASPAASTISNSSLPIKLNCISDNLKFEPEPSQDLSVLP